MKISVLTPSIRPEGLAITQKCLQQQTLDADHFEWLVDIGLPPKHDLNASYNRMLRRAKGDLIVSLQDFIQVRPDYLQKFWDAHLAHPRTFFTAPVGKVDNLFFTPPARWDWRAYEDAKPNWRCWEIDSGCAPKDALFEIGGFDEELDKHWSCDNLNVGCRADIAGYEFANLFDNPGIAYDHDAHIAHPFRERFNQTFNTKRMAMFRGGMTINYLA